MTAGKPRRTSRIANLGGKSRRRFPARGILWLIALSLAGSGLLRLGGGTGQALAREVAALAEHPVEAGAVHTPVGGTCAAPPDLEEVLTVLNERRQRLDEREADLADRSQALALAQTRIREELAALKSAEEELKGTLALADSAAEKDLARLTAVYESMKPKEAAPVFAAMDPQFAAGFLGRMRPDAAAAILSGLEPNVAYTISVVLAGRNANVPTE